MQPAYLLRAKLLPAALLAVTLLLLLCFGAEAEATDNPPSTAATTIGVASLNGPFHDPAYAGEGIVLQVIDDQRVLLVWFTYNSLGQQRWLLGNGQIVGNSIRIDEWQQTHGPVFGANYDSDDLVRTLNGSGSITIHNCSQLELDYTIDGHSGSRQLQRLLPVAGNSCDDGFITHRGSLSGSFADPDRDGEGIVIQVTATDQALVVWFTYDDQGQPMWLLGSGTISGNHLQIAQVQVTSGGRFGDDYDPDQVERRHWGEWTLELACDQVTLDYSSVDPRFSSGQWQLARGLTLAGRDCDASATHELPGLVCGPRLRTELAAAQLQTGLIRRVDNSAYAPAHGCQPPLQAFNGQLSFNSSLMATVQSSGSLGNRARFPAFSNRFITVGHHLIPVNPQRLRDPAHPTWSIVVGNGLIWSEPADGPYSRISLPFTLSHNIFNESHNGVMMMLFDGQSMTQPVMQITQETVPWNQIDYWGRLDANYQAIDRDTVAHVEQEFRREMAYRWPLYPLSDLVADRDDQPLADFKRDLSNRSISQTGVALNGALYMEPAQTRRGLYPFPEDMRHGVYSITKTAGAAVAMLWLAQRYGANVFDERIVDYVDVSASHDGWANVTFADALSMVTGIGDASPQADAAVVFADEGDAGNPRWMQYLNATTMEQSLAAAFSFNNYPWGPGEVVRYHSAHTTVLAVAMDQYLKSQEGPSADLWEMLNLEVCQRIGLRWIPSMRIPWADGSRGPAPLAWGMLATVHDLSRIAQLLHQDGQWDGQSLLHEDLTRRLMRRNEAPYPTPLITQREIGQFSDITYQDATWGISFTSSLGCPVNANWMQGFGGNYVMMMPGDLTLIRIADQEVYNAGSLALTGDRMRPQCSE
ncbi:MAG: hypothetical protein Tsb002_19730 [Wenzhouxiangellaceae bacterium]